MEVSGAAHWVISRVYDLAAVGIITAIVGAAAAKVGITCVESVRRAWVSRGQQ